jgi:hypothetical protein
MAQGSKEFSPFKRESVKKSLNCFCWKALTPYLGPSIN